MAVRRNDVTEYIREHARTYERHERPLVARDQVIRWLSHPGPLTVCTHVHVDADAAFSAALALYMAESAGKPCTLRFLGANTVVDDADQLAVDMSNGASAIKGKGAGSAFGALVYALPVRTPRTSP